MIAEGTVGQRTASDGVTEEHRLGRYTAVAMMDAHGRYYDCVTRGNCFVVAQQAAAALGTALTATVATLCLYNPSGSGKNLVLLETTLVIPTATTAGFVTYAVNDIPASAIPATTTALTIRNALLGGGTASIARAYSIATLPAAPIAVRHLAGIISTTPGGVHTIVDDVAGKLILAPNTAVTIQGVTTNATGAISMLWEEVTP